MIDTSDSTDGVAIPELALPNPSGGISPKRGTATDFMASQVQNLIAVRTEEEQQAAASQREQQGQDVAARKDARRKSLGTSDFRVMDSVDALGLGNSNPLTIGSKSKSLICTRSDFAYLGRR